MNNKFLLLITLVLTSTISISNTKNNFELKPSKDPMAEFTFAITGRAPVSVQFVNQSKNAEIFNWDFGDGTTSTEENPVHTYNEGGPYIVTLRVSLGDKHDKIQSIVKVEEKPSKVIINKISLKKMPLLQPDGKPWDRDGGVELYVKILDGNNNNNTLLKKSNVLCENLNINNQLQVNALFNNLKLRVINDTYFIVFMEYDEWSDNEQVGFLGVNFNNYAIVGKDQYPTNIFLEQNGMIIDLDLDWE
ncbi:PKD domain-containing protein [Lutibacter agarilyticus]|uniref:PKD domain-containing protein n=1 Tax=Lutibacter agarilyticus TaxID=1109740 RepID=A0A238XHF4_9FLAO|nr:PKD domain-containing protein [Lutibacter agarilyticus]SNR57923.1 PKD domain-containing protein [Lutibacter agarilyticus]